MLRPQELENQYQSPESEASMKLVDADSFGQLTMWRVGVTMSRTGRMTQLTAV